MSFRCVRGTVMVETLIAFIPLFMLFLGIVQYALLSAAQLVVRHAAVAGVRSASVVLDDDPAYYDGAARLSIVGGRAGGASVLAGLALFMLSEVPGAPDVPDGLAEIIGRTTAPRMKPIRTAVYAKLAAIVPAQALASFGESPGVSVLDTLGTAPALRLVQAPLYLPVTTAITFPRSPGAAELFEGIVEPEGALTLRVTHLTTCTVPLVSAIMCQRFIANPHDELRLAPAAPFQEWLAKRGVRVKRLQAEATMPLQRARYTYARRSSGQLP
jgi:hypothetical protein